MKTLITLLLFFPYIIALAQTKTPQTSDYNKKLNEDLGICNIEDSPYPYHFRAIYLGEYLVDVWLEDSIVKGNIYNYLYQVNKSDKPVHIYNYCRHNFEQYPVPDSILETFSFLPRSKDSPIGGRLYCGFGEKEFTVFEKQLNSISIADSPRLFENKCFRYRLSLARKNSAFGLYTPNQNFENKISTHPFSSSSVSPEFSSRQEQGYYSNYIDNIGELNGFVQPWDENIEVNNYLRSTNRRLPVLN